MGALYEEAKWWMMAAGTATEAQEGPVAFYLFIYFFVFMRKQFIEHTMINNVLLADKISVAI